MQVDHDYQLTMWILGGIATGASALAFAAYRVFIYIGRRVFDAPDGIVEKSFTRWDTYTADLFMRMDKQLSMCDQHGTVIVQLDERFGNGDDFKTTDTNKSLADLARVELIKLRTNADMTGDDRTKMIELLSAVVERLDPEEPK